MKVEVTQKLERSEWMMIRWMCGVTLIDNNSTEKTDGKLRYRICVRYGEAWYFEMNM